MSDDRWQSIGEVADRLIAEMKEREKQSAYTKGVHDFLRANKPGKPANSQRKSVAGFREKCQRILVMFRIDEEAGP